MPIADLADTTIFYTDEGSGPPVVLVHGWTCDSHDWSWQIPSLLANHRVVAMDLRGHGRSGVPEAGYTPKQFAADVLAVLDQLGIDRAVFVGHSLGGVIVSTIAVEHPDRVAAVVAVDPAYGVDPSLLPMIEMMRDTFDVAPLDAAGIAFAIFYTDDTPAHLRTWHERRLAGDPPHVVRDTFLNIYFGPDAWAARPAADAYLARRSCPTFAVYADEGRSELDRVLLGEDGRFEVWPEAGHFLHQEQPDRFNALLAGWLTELDPW
ncbi:MAG: alpha/beta hydrolase [Actinomycetota bacterium]|nr:alpha/beta hydrolase [Actinomycetota bacterium]